MPSAMAQSSAGSHGAVGAITVVLAAYFLIAAWPWLSAAVGAGRRTLSGAGANGPGQRRMTLEAASHAIMSVGMAALLMIMA
jgi:hypothetical protein